jgi:CO dehydrogenase/acetyl-CoA synthase epsilon subunit
LEQGQFPNWLIDFAGSYRYTSHLLANHFSDAQFQHQAVVLAGEVNYHLHQMNPEMRHQKSVQPIQSDSSYRKARPQYP